ncbi:hypothetical protein ACFXP3_13705 [Streptomyces sp. NPDC059096]|uniref:hypothetical protein n=1 Tax=Streptomyces sp. NPDC059096 TaxID=3346727 RepID=UPI0036ADFE88
MIGPVVPQSLQDLPVGPLGGDALVVLARDGSDRCGRYGDADPVEPSAVRLLLAGV